MRVKKFNFSQPRYVIPRYVDFIADTWISRILPQILGRYFQRSTRTMQMLHAVPAVFAKNKELANIYQRHWNIYVSPGDVVFAQRGAGEQLVEQATRKGQIAPLQPHRKGIFL